MRERLVLRPPSFAIFPVRQFACPQFAVRRPLPRPVDPIHRQRGHDLAAVGRGGAHVVDGRDFLGSGGCGLADQLRRHHLAAEDRLGRGARMGVGATEPKASRQSTIRSPSRTRCTAALALAMSAATRPILTNALPACAAGSGTSTAVRSWSARRAVLPGPRKKRSSGSRVSPSRADQHHLRAQHDQGRGRVGGRRAVAQVAADRAHRLHLRRAERGARFRQRGVAAAHASYLVQDRGWSSVRRWSVCQCPGGCPCNSVSLPMPMT